MGGGSLLLIVNSRVGNTQIPRCISIAPGTMCIFGNKFSLTLGGGERRKQCHSKKVAQPVFLFRAPGIILLKNFHFWSQCSIRDQFCPPAWNNPKIDRIYEIIISKALNTGNKRKWSKIGGGQGEKGIPALPAVYTLKEFIGWWSLEDSVRWKDKVKSLGRPKQI